MREHGGDIEVESELGAGTRFELSFPEAGRAETKPRRECGAASASATPVSRASPLSAACRGYPPLSSAVGSSPRAVAQSDRLIQ